MKRRHRYIIEFILAVILAVAGGVLTFILKDNYIAVALTSTSILFGIYEAINVLRDSLHNNEMLNGFEQTNSLINYTNKYIHVDRLEAIEREFCHKEKKNATIYVISNNLTKDREQFLDEIVANIKNGVSYKYVVDKNSLNTANVLKAEVKKRLTALEQEHFRKKFKIYEKDSAFTLVTSKYTVVIYTNGRAELSSSNCLGYCCAQDSVDNGIFYYEISYKNSLKLKSNIDSLINS